MVKSMKWKMMFEIMLVVIFVIGAFSIYIYHTTSQNMKRNGEALVESVAMGMEGAIHSRLKAEEIMEKEMLGQSVMASYIIHQGTTYEDLKEIAQRSGIDEIWSTDNKGNTGVTSVAPSIEFNFGSDPNGQAAEYMQLLDGRAQQIVQKAQIRDIDNEFYKFVGVGGWDSRSPQIIQVARHGQQLLDLEASIGSAYYVNELKEHLSATVLYAAMVSEAGEVLAATSEQPLADLGFNSQHFADEALNQWTGKYNNERVTQYVKKLSNGSYLAVSVSNAILTKIQVSTVIAALLVIAVIFIVTNLTLSRQVSRILAVKGSLEDIGQGEADLTKRIQANSQDEIGQLVVAFNAMMDNFQQIIRDLQQEANDIQHATTTIQHNASQTLQASQTIQAQSEQAAEGSSRQLTSTQESAYAMGELAQGIQHIAEAITEISAISRTTEENANGGLAIMNQLQKHLTMIYEKNDSSVARTEQLAKLSSTIGDFTNVITDISNQTNLLALNASIEAARAGEAGKGFAVVADEVRKLAVDSKTAAERISQVVTNVQLETNEIVQVIRSLASVLDEGHLTADKVQQSFEGINADIRSLAVEVDSVSGAAQEIAASTQEVTATMEDVSGLAKQTSGGMKEMAEQVSDQVESMDNMTTAITQLNDTVNSLKRVAGHYKV
ncbi:methyl-accepting chemotaxis protein [Metasolibacillus meyeri]|uniref:methyl-accepting chemotaxis protein n=1 Tax=Metasolibacillus meyeri TaxID=1071052 RepID=UPI000D30119F|nr:methyl-accepting chemotaxis protein [Metasolibacillus meyeri]